MRDSDALADCDSPLARVGCRYLVEMRLTAEGPRLAVACVRPCWIAEAAEDVNLSDGMCWATHTYAHMAMIQRCNRV